MYACISRTFSLASRLSRSISLVLRFPHCYRSRHLCFELIELKLYRDWFRMCPHVTRVPSASWRNTSHNERFITTESSRDASRDKRFVIHGSSVSPVGKHLLAVGKVAPKRTTLSSTICWCNICPIYSQCLANENILEIYWTIAPMNCATRDVYLNVSVTPRFSQSSYTYLDRNSRIQIYRASR